MKVSSDLLNIAFMVLALSLAIFLPFELFLFSYAVLGPLHYLTEIHWLRKRNYFIELPGNWHWIFIGIALLATVFPISKLLGLSFGVLEKNNETGFYSGSLVFAAFIFAAILLFVRNRIGVLLSAPISIAIAFALMKWIPLHFMALGILLPTLIHVYLFTLLFMIYGLLKSPSRIGWLAVALLLLSHVAIYFLELEGLSEEAGALYNESEMPAVNYIMASIWNSLSGEFPSASALRKFQVFIAFAYTYHYLNWFSKTSIIGWKNTLTKRSALLIGGIWLMAVSLYAYDYKTGFALLFFLSFLHVFLEFPLNWLTIKSVDTPFNRTALIDI